MQTSKYGKSFDIKKRGMSRSEHKNVELPMINKTIDVVSRYELSADNPSTFLEKFLGLLTEKSYDEMRDAEIYREYQQLRKQIFALNDLVIKQLEKFQRKAERKKLITQIQPQRVNQIRQKQIQNNLCILQRMKKQFTGLKTKSNTLPAKQTIQEEIQNVKQSISQIKHKIASLKLKNKAIGESIINTDQVLMDLKQAQRQSDVWIRKKKQLQSKLDKVMTQTEEVHINLEKINQTSSSADQFMKVKSENSKAEQEKRVNLQIYNEKQRSVQVLRKNLEIFSSQKQQKYHQLLKQLQGHLQKDQAMKARTQQIEYNLVEFSDQIKVLQTKLIVVKEENSSFGFYQNSIVVESRSIDSDQSFSTQVIKPNQNHLRLSIFARNREPSTSSQKTSAKKFLRSEISTAAQQIITSKLMMPKINAQKFPQSIPPKSAQHQTYKTLSKIQQTKFLTNNLRKEQKQELKTSKQIENQEKKIKKIDKIDESQCPIKVNFMYVQKQGKEKVKQKKQTSINMTIKQTNKAKNSYIIDLQSIKTEQQQNQAKLASKSPEYQNRIQRKVNPSTQNKASQEIPSLDSHVLISEQSNDKQKEQIDQMNEQIVDNTIQTIDQNKKSKMEQPKLQRLTIDLGSIQKNIEKVSQQRLKIKEKIASNLSKNLIESSKSKNLNQSSEKEELNLQ